MIIKLELKNIFLLKKLLKELLHYINYNILREKDYNKILK
jgi:hypothetical protein